MPPRRCLGPDRPCSISSNRYVATPDMNVCNMTQRPQLPPAHIIRCQPRARSETQTRRWRDAIAHLRSYCGSRPSATDTNSSKLLRRREKDTRKTTIPPPSKIIVTDRCPPLRGPECRESPSSLLLEGSLRLGIVYSQLPEPAPLAMARCAFARSLSSPATLSQYCARPLHMFAMPTGLALLAALR